MRTMRQCCNNECNNNILCEEDAWKRYKTQRMKAYKMMLTSKIVWYTIPFIVGFIIGKLS
jgi:hypothetical protein